PRSTTGRAPRSGGRRWRGSSRSNPCCSTPASRRPSAGARARTLARRAVSCGRVARRPPVAEPGARTVSFATLGCRLNQVDTQQIQAALEARGFRTVAFDEPADVVVVNTWTVTASAEFSDRQMIRRGARVCGGAMHGVTGRWAKTSQEG